MKKTVFFALAAFAIAALSCNKVETGTSDKQDIRIHINVSDVSTKAVKTGWTNGDKINIWFDGSPAQTPNLIITYDGSKWVPGSLDETAEAALKTDGTGTFKYLYEAGNDITAFSYDDYGSFTKYAFPTATIGSQNCFSPVLTICSPGIDPNYSYDGTDLTLNLSDWCYITNVQVVVTGELSGNPEDWYLYVLTPTLTWLSIQDFRNDESGFSFGNSLSDTHSSRGTTNEEGVAFYLRMNNSKIYNVDPEAAYSSMLTDHYFTLGNSAGRYHYS